MLMMFAKLRGNSKTPRKETTQPFPPAGLEVSVLLLAGAYVTKLSPCLSRVTLQRLCHLLGWRQGGDRTNPCSVRPNSARWQEGLRHSVSGPGTAS